MLCEVALRGAPLERLPWKVVHSSLFRLARLGVPKFFLRLSQEMGLYCVREVMAFTEALLFESVRKLSRAWCGYATPMSGFGGKADVPIMLGVAIATENLDHSRGILPAIAGRDGSLQQAHGQIREFAVDAGLSRLTLQSRSRTRSDVNGSSDAPDLEGIVVDDLRQRLRPVSRRQEGGELLQGDALRLADVGPMDHAEHHADQAGQQGQVEGRRRSDIRTEMAQVATQTLEKCLAVLESFLRSGHQDLGVGGADVAGIDHNRTVQVGAAMLPDPDVAVARLLGGSGAQLDSIPSIPEPL